GKLARRLMNDPVLPLMAYAPVYGQAMRGTVRPAFVGGAVIATALFAFGDYIDEPGCCGGAARCSRGARCTDVPSRRDGDRVHVRPLDPRHH
ncbi:MAG: hypothetical protein ABEI97_03450, partial [Candidatus Nanohaloarchaea archaeon]